MFFPGMVFAEEGHSDAMVESILFLGEKSGKETVQVQLNGDIEPKMFELPGEKPRVVFDFVGTSYGEKKKRVIKAGGKIVKRIRVGVHHQPVSKTRIVIDLANDQKYTIDQRFVPTTKVLEIQVSLKQKDDGVKEVVSEQIPSASMRDGIREEKNATVLPDAQMVKPTGQKNISDTQSVSLMADRKPVTSQSQNEASLVPEPNKAAPTLLSVSYEETTNKKEMVLFRVSGFHPPVVFAIEEEEPRIVCDFLDVLLGENIEDVLNSDGNYIKRVRVARHSSPEKVRVVLDLVADNNYELKQVFFKEDNLFVVVISNLTDK